MSPNLSLLHTGAKRKKEREPFSFMLLTTTLTGIRRCQQAEKLGIILHQAWLGSTECDFRSGRSFDKQNFRKCWSHTCVLCLSFWVYGVRSETLLIDWMSLLYIIHYVTVAFKMTWVSRLLIQNIVLPNCQLRCLSATFSELTIAVDEIM